MAVVPPGNKQLGEFSVITTYGAASGIVNINANVLQGQTVVQTTTTSEPVAVHNLQLGEHTTVVTYGASAGLTSVSASVIQGLAVVNLSPTTVYKDYVTQGLIAVADPEASNIPLEPIKPLQLGEHTTVVTYGAADNLINTTCQQLEAFAVVQEFVPRNELTIFNIEYAAEN